MNPHPVAEVQRGCDDRLLVGQSRPWGAAGNRSAMQPVADSGSSRFLEVTFSL